MAYDLLIENGSVVDGTGAPARHADVAIKDGAIVEIGRVSGTAKRVFDPASVGSRNRGERRWDLPGGGKRMVMPSHGVEHTIVNGEVIYADGALTGAAPGRVLRS